MNLNILRVGDRSQNKWMNERTNEWMNEQIKRQIKDDLTNESQYIKSWW